MDILNQFISMKAATIANHDPRIPAYLQGDIFHAGFDPQTLSLEYEKHLLVGAIKVARGKQIESHSVNNILKLLDEIAYDAIYESLSTPFAIKTLAEEHLRTL